MCGFMHENSSPSLAAVIATNQETQHLLKQEERLVLASKTLHRCLLAYIPDESGFDFCRASTYQEFLEEIRVHHIPCLVEFSACASHQRTSQQFHCPSLKVHAYNLKCPYLDVGDRSWGRRSTGCMSSICTHAVGRVNCWLEWYCECMILSCVIRSCCFPSCGLESCRIIYKLLLLQFKYYIHHPRFPRPTDLESSMHNKSTQTHHHTEVSSWSPTVHEKNSQLVYMDAQKLIWAKIDGSGLFQQENEICPLDLLTWWYMSNFVYHRNQLVTHLTWLLACWVRIISRLRIGTYIHGNDPYPSGRGATSNKSHAIFCRCAGFQTLQNPHINAISCRILQGESISSSPSHRHLSCVSSY